MFETNQEDAYETYSQRKAVENAPLLAKWLEILFWMSIANLVLGFIFSNSLVERIPILYYVSMTVDYIYAFAYALILLQLKDASGAYGTAGCLMGITYALDFILTVFHLGEILLFSLLGAVLLLASEYHKYKAHSKVLEGVNDELSQKWEKLWQFYIIFLFSVIASILLIVFLPPLGMILTVASGIAILICAILEFCFLHRSAKTFDSYKSYRPTTIEHTDDFQ